MFVCCREHVPGHVQLFSLTMFLCPLALKSLFCLFFPSQSFPVISAAVSGSGRQPSDLQSEVAHLLRAVEHTEMDGVLLCFRL